jgi:hypothetical protein
MIPKLRFGEYLLNQKIIKSHELVIALEKQKLFGGKLGINLAECGFIKDAELNQYLKKFENYISKP